MSFTKYADVEKAEVLSPDQHVAIHGGLRRAGKTSVQELTATERDQLRPEDAQD